MTTAFDTATFHSGAFDAVVPPPPTGWTDLGQIAWPAAASTTWGKTISNLTLFNGKVFLGYGDYTQNTPNPCKLLGWDIAVNALVDYGTINTVAVLDNNVVNGQLAVPYTDPATGTYPTIRFVNADGTSEELGGGNNTPRAWHIYGSVYFGGKRYISGAHFDGATTANGYGIWRDDAGVWVNPDFTPNSYLGSQFSTTTAYRVYGLFVLGSALYAGIGSGIFKTTTGAAGSWSSVTSGVARMKKPLIVGSYAWFGNADPGWITSSLSKFNGNTRTVVVSSGVWDHTVGTDGNLYYLTDTRAIKNEAGQTVETAPVNARSVAYINGEFWCGTSDSHLWRRYP